MANYYRALPSDDILLADIAAGLRNFEIAEKHKVARKTVDNYIRTKHLRLDEAARKALTVAKPKIDRRRSSLPGPDGIRKLLDAGLSNDDIASQYRVSRKTVEGHLRRNGMSRNRTATVPSNEEITAYLKQHMTCTEIAVKHGCSKTAIAERIKKHDLRGENVDRAEPVAPRPRDGVIVDRYFNASLPALSILRDCERYGRTA